MILKVDWNLKLLTKTSFQKKRVEIIKVHKKFADKWQKNNNWQTNPVVLKQALTEYEVLQKDYTAGAEEGYYYSLLSNIKENDNKIKAGYNKVRQFSLQMNNQILFFEHRLARLPKTTKKLFLKSPILNSYTHFLKRVFDQEKYLLSEAEEKILTLKADVSFNNWVKMTSGFLSGESAEIKTGFGKTVKKNFSEILSLMNDKNEKVRHQASLVFNEILNKHIKVGEAELNSILMDKKIEDELRKMERPDLARHLADDIDTKVVDVMLAVVAKNNHLAQRFYKLKAKLLGLKKLKYHERNLTIGEIKKSYNYHQACTMVAEVLQSLNPNYADVFNNFVKSGQIDVYPKNGKTGGAFCASGLLSTPTYIMLNHTNELKDVLTLAHEVGHGLNNELMRGKQNSLNFGVTLATAEVASTFFEDFVLKKLLTTATKEERLSIIMEKLNQDVSTIFRQSALYQFELELHASFRKTGYLSVEQIGKIFTKHMSAYMGAGVEQSAGSQNWWLHWSHIRYLFYVYSYVSGLLISKHFQRQVASDANYIKKVDYFLSAGLSEAPVNIFKQMGIDISNKQFWQEGMNEIENLLNQAEELAIELKKI